MSFKSRTSVNNTFWNSPWVAYAVSRTGVALNANFGNCFGYATARISEILGKNQDLDGGHRVAYASQLWENHNPKFKQMNYAKKGALMIWSNWMWIDGQWADAGHVAVCEDIIDANTIQWSQSSYGGTVFETVKGNPNGYNGMTFKGYLWHDELPGDEEETTSTPEVTNINGLEVIKENGTARFLTGPVNVRDGGPNGMVVAQYNKGQEVNYWGKYIGNGHRYVVYTSFTGKIRFVAISGSEEYGKDKWAECY